MAAGKRKKKVETVFLVCEETGDHNYTIRRKTGGEKLKLSKFSPRLRKHTLHVEKKKKEKGQRTNADARRSCSPSHPSFVIRELVIPHGCPNAGGLRAMIRRE